jgi:hypothetical protein
LSADSRISALFRALDQEGFNSKLSTQRHEENQDFMFFFVSLCLRVGFGSATTNPRQRAAEIAASLTRVLIINY